MNKDIKRRWVEALRSGEYKQGRKALHRVNDNGDEFCCLGVLCDLGVKAGVVAPVMQGDLVAYNIALKVLPVSIRQWAGVGTCDGSFGSPGGLKSLASLNDMGSTFSEIADVIEREF